MTPKMIEIGPLTLSRGQWSQFKLAIRQAFVEWNAWSGGQGNGEEQDEYKAIVAKERERVFLIIDQLEDVGKGKPHP